MASWIYGVAARALAGSAHILYVTHITGWKFTLYHFRGSEKTKRRCVPRFYLPGDTCVYFCCQMG